MKSFALIGAGGYVAPRHLRAIKEVGGDLKVALDPSDSVGVLDSYFPDARFFVEFERFDRHVDKLARAGEGIDYVSICSPNYLHDAHVRFAMRSGADAICEKPLVLNPWNLDGLAELSARTNRSVSTILQLRLHPAIRALRERVMRERGRNYELDLTYITSRGRWYHVSWKGNEGKSGGIATNIGVHFFDMLAHVFGAGTGQRTASAFGQARGRLSGTGARAGALVPVGGGRGPARGAPRADRPPGARSSSTARSSSSPTASPTCTPKATGKSSPAAASALTTCGRRWRSSLRCAQRRWNGPAASGIRRRGRQ